MRPASFAVVTFLVLAGVCLGIGGCAEPDDDEDPRTDVSGNQPICMEARARVAAQCKGAVLPSFADACDGRDRCRAGCIYDHPCDGTAQEKCVADGC